MNALVILVRFLFVPTAWAVTLETAGQNSSGGYAPGVGLMWERIKPLFVGRGDLLPDEAVLFFVERIGMFLFSIIGAVAVGLVMYAGIRVMIGGEEGLTEAKKIVLYTLIGVVLALLAGGVIAFVGGVLSELLS
jgi:hypothetical protein